MEGEGAMEIGEEGVVMEEEVIMGIGGDTTVIDRMVVEEDMEEGMEEATTEIDKTITTKEADIKT